MEFAAFPKIARLNREIVITEKLDGTNASIYIERNISGTINNECCTEVLTDEGILYNLWYGSRNRWITPKNDNYGFAGWAALHCGELVKLGEGHHYGEWWGNGIQRGYGLKEKRFSLFNTERWSDDAVRPKCCHVVPVIDRGSFHQDRINDALKQLSVYGSRAAPGYMNPEGVVVYHIAGKTMFKVTLENDESPKGKVTTNGS